MSIQDTIRRVFTRAPQPERAAVLSEPTPVERGEKPRDQEFGTADELVKLVGERKRSALQQRRPAERDWVLNIAAYFGGRGQWLRWDDDRHFAESMMLASEPRVRYVTHNLIKPLIKKRIALSTMTKPDAQIAAGSPAPIDRDAAGEARCISAHLARLWKSNFRRAQISSGRLWSLVIPCKTG